MRSVPSASFQCLSSPEGLWSAWLQCRRGKRRQPAIAQFDLNADRAVFALSRQLCSGRYQPQTPRVKLVYDPKPRLVAAPAIADRIVQTALLNAIAPTYEQGFIDQSYACCSGRGPHRAVLAYLQLSRRYDFRLQLDIRRYFASINHAVLYGLFAHRLHDRQTLGLIETLLHSGGAVYAHEETRRLLGLGEDFPRSGVGMPLGAHLSHWSGGLYLDGLDHFIKRDLKFRGYLRYMDDFSLFHDDPARLEAAREAVPEWLLTERRLRLKDPVAPVQSTRQASSYLGFRVSRAGLAPGPKAKRRLRQRLRQAEAMGGVRLTKGLQAYRGLLLSIG